MPHIGSDEEPALDGQPHDQSAEAAEARIRQHVEDLLDQALEETFPASDPTSIALPRGWTARRTQR